MLLDRDLAALYGVPTRVLIQAVKRNPRRFPDDFLFQLSAGELENWKSQFVTSNSSLKMGPRKLPYAFTGTAVAILSSVLRSERAVAVNIEILRLRQAPRAACLPCRAELERRLAVLEGRADGQDARISAVFSAIQ